MQRKERTPTKTGPVKYAWFAFAVVAYAAMAGGLYSLASNTVFWGRSRPRAAAWVSRRWRTTGRGIDM